jgi:hypothetical protein
VVATVILQFVTFSTRRWYVACGSWLGYVVLVGVGHYDRRGSPGNWGRGAWAFSIVLTAFATGAAVYLYLVRPARWRR